MTEAIIGLNDYLVEDPIGIDELDSVDTVTAMENIGIIYHGLLTTPYRAYRDERVKTSLENRVRTLSASTNYSCEDIIDNINCLVEGTYSTENVYFDAVQKVIDKIIEWLSKAREYVMSILRRILDIRKQNQAASKQTNNTYKQAQEQYKKDKREFPERIRCELPGNCYLVFHNRKHVPEAGYVYNTQGLIRAIDYVDRDMNTFINALSKDIDVTLEAVKRMVDTLTINENSQNIDALKRLKSARQVSDLYHSHFEVIGFSITERAVRRATPHFPVKHRLTNVVDQYGWNGIESFNLAIETAEFENINKLVQDKTTLMLSRIIQLTEMVSNSQALKRLAALQKERRLLVTLSEGMGDELSVTLNTHKDILARLDLIQEIVGQVVDNTMLASRFYTRYSQVMSRMLANIADSLKKSSD